MMLRKNAKFIFVPMCVITSEYESSFLSLVLEANLCLDSDVDEPDPHVHKKVNVEKVAFSTSNIP